MLSLHGANGLYTGTADQTPHGLPTKLQALAFVFAVIVYIHDLRLELNAFQP